MTKIHFVKDGKRPNGERMTTDYEVPFSNIQQHLLEYNFEYSESPPTINPDVTASDLSEYKHVVIEISDEDVGETPFGKPGFYYIPGLAAAKCHEILNLPGRVF